MKKIIYIITIFLLLSCKYDKNIQKSNILEIDKEVFSSQKIIPTDSFFTEIQCVKLETKQEILIKHIKDIYLYKDLFFIFHENQISVFDKNGNFLRKIGNEGNGPGEYNYLPEGIAFYDSLIYLNDQHLKKILIYSLQGNYIKTLTTNHVFSQFKILDNKLLVGYTPNKLGNEPNKLYLYNIDGMVIDSIKNDMIYNNFNAIYSFSFQNPLFSLNDTSIGFKEVLSDTIYKINPNFSLHPIWILNLGDLKLNPDDIYNQKDLFKSLNHGKKVLEILYNNENYMIIKDADVRFTVLLWDKNNNSINNVKFLYNKDLAKHFNKEKDYIQIVPNDASSKVMIKDGTPYFMPISVSEDNKYLIGYETSAANEEDNPIIVLAEMK